MLQRIELEVMERSMPPLELWVEGAGTKAVQLKNVEGLGPVKAEINTTAYSKIKGAVFNTSNLGVRNIVITVGLNDPEGDISTLRRELYDYVMPQIKLLTRFYIPDMPIVQIEGYVEDCAPVLFTKDPEMQISILCPDPDFVAAVETVISGVTQSPSLPAPEEVLYLGTAPAPGTFLVKPNVSIPVYEGALSIHSALMPQLVTNLTHAIVLDDVTIEADQWVRLTTYPLNRGIRYVGDGTTGANLLNMAVFDNGWPTLYRGTNELSVVAYNESAVGQDWTFTYFDRYGGL